MRRIVALGLVAGLFVGVFAAPAQAKKKPLVTTLFLHGSSPLGEVDSNAANGEFGSMDTTEPKGGQSKSKQITNLFITPNVVCAGNQLFPVWVGNVKGKIVGDMKLTFSAIGTPGTVLIRVWPDVQALMCNQDYVKPAAEVEASLPAGMGTVEVVIPKVNFSAKQSLMLQISPFILVDTPDPTPFNVLGPFVSRVVYDSTAAPSALEFTCIPKGKSCA